MRKNRGWVQAGFCMGAAGLLSLAVLGTAAEAANPPPGYTRIEQNDAAVTYTGSWATVSSQAYSGGSAANSVAAGDQAQLDFTGTAVQWIGSSGPSTCMADVLLDGILVTTVNTASKHPASQVALYAVNGLTRASHTLTVRVKKIGKGPQAGGVWIDAFDVLPVSSDTTPPTVDMTAPANGATVSGTVSVSADATDNVGVASVQFELDDAPLGPALTTSPYVISWDSRTMANGMHTLLAVARDAAG
ncbi:MAG: Ig-like domain-containing protein, partial [Gammaproteobacteria bacterium]